MVAVLSARSGAVGEAAFGEVTLLVRAVNPRKFGFQFFV